MARKKHQDGVERRAPSMVLIISDDADSGELMSRLLSARHFRTTTAKGLDDTMTHISEILPRAVVLDLASGGIGSNLKVLESIRNHGDRKVNRTRVVLIARSPKNKVFSFQSGVDEFLVRPFHAEELVTAVTDALRRPHEERSEYRRLQLEGVV